MYFVLNVRSHEQNFGAFLQVAAQLVPLFYTSLLACSLGYSSEIGALLIALSSGALMGIADKIGRQNTMVANVFLSALTVLTLWLRESKPAFIIFSISGYILIDSSCHICGNVRRFQCLASY
jgi:hypothetical protein